MALPRFHRQSRPDVVSFESAAFTAEEKTELKKRGHTLNEMRQTYGNLKIICQLTAIIRHSFPFV